MTQHTVLIEPIVTKEHTCLHRKMARGRCSPWCPCVPDLRTQRPLPLDYLICFPDQ